MRDSALCPKAAHADVLADRLAASEAEKAELAEQVAKAEEKAAKADEKPPAKPAGPPPVEHGEPAQTTGDDQDFMAVSWALAEEKDITITEAMRRTARANPELHRAFVQAARDNRR